MQRAEVLWAGLPGDIAAALEMQGLGCHELSLWCHLWEDDDDLEEFMRQVCDCELATVDGVRIIFRELQQLARSRPIKRVKRDDQIIGMAQMDAQARRAELALLTPAAEHILLKALAPKARERRRGRKGYDDKLRNTEDPRAREKLETEEHDRWADVLAEELAAAQLPRALHAGLTANPQQSLKRAAGSSRFRTVRARVRKWQVLRRWLLTTFGVNWPGHVGQVIDYLEAIAAEPCARTIPRSIVSALAFMEEKGEVPYEKRMTAMTMLKSTLKSIELQLNAGAPETGNCLLYTS